jgi:hypothetical protein
MPHCTQNVTIASYPFSQVPAPGDTVRRMERYNMDFLISQELANLSALELTRAPVTAATASGGPRELPAPTGATHL